MAQAKSIPTTSRRKFLAGAAGAAFSTSLAVGSADPVFAAIDGYHAATAGHERAVSAVSHVVRAPKVLSDAASAAAGRVNEALEALYKTIPTTMPGVMAMLAFQRETLNRDPYELEAAHLSYICEAVETALKRIV